MLLLHHMFNFYNFISLPIAGCFLLIVSLSIFILCHIFICWLCFLFCPFCPGENSKQAQGPRRGPLAAAWLGYTKDLLVPGSSEATGVTWEPWDPGSESFRVLMDTRLGQCKCCSTNGVKQGAP